MHDTLNKDRLHDAVAELMGYDRRIIDILGLLVQIVKLMEHHSDCMLGDEHLSTARVRLLTRLWVGEVLGEEEVSPTDLSRYHNVSRNTISALLAALEDQALIERAIDPDDRRRFHIRLTDAGRDLARERAPMIGAQARAWFADIPAEERQMLLRLLRKVRTGLVSAHCGHESDADAHHEV
jgi:DNA-binding MarR family transcriptional regulator